MSDMKYITRRGPKKYEVVIRAAGLYPTFATRAQARAWRDAALRALAAGVPVPHPDHYRTGTDGPDVAITVADALRRHRDFVKAANSYDDVWETQVVCADNKVIASMGAGKRLAEMTQCDVLKLQEDLWEDGLAPSTATRPLQRCRTVWTYGVAWGWCSGPNPGQGVHAKPQKPGTRKMRLKLDIFKIEEVLAIAGLIEKPSYRLLFVLLRFLGLRIGEGLGVQAQDIDLALGLVGLRRQVTGGVEKEHLKTGAGSADADPEAAQIRLVGIPRTIGAVIAELVFESHGVTLEELPSTTRLVKGSDTGFRDSLTDAQRQLGLTDKAGKTQTPKDLRAMYSVDLHRAGVSVADVGVTMGHFEPSKGASMVTMRHYLILAFKDDEQVKIVTGAAKKYNEWLVANEDQLHRGFGPPPEDEETVSLAEAGDILGVPFYTVRRLAAENRIDFVKVHKAQRVTVASIVAERERTADRVDLKNVVAESSASPEEVAAFLADRDLAIEFDHGVAYVSVSAAAITIEAFHTWLAAHSGFVTTREACRQLALSETALKLLIESKSISTILVEDVIGEPTTLVDQRTIDRRQRTREQQRLRGHRACRPDQSRTAQARDSMTIANVAEALMVSESAAARVLQRWGARHVGDAGESSYDRADVEALIEERFPVGYIPLKQANEITTYSANAIKRWSQDPRTGVQFIDANRAVGRPFMVHEATLLTYWATLSPKDDEIHVVEAAMLASISPSLVYDAIYNGELESRRTLEDRWVRKSHVVEWIAKRGLRAVG